jgi:hypothetical protein
LNTVSASEGDDGYYFELLVDSPERSIDLYVKLRDAFFKLPDDERKHYHGPGRLRHLYADIAVQHK